MGEHNVDQQFDQRKLQAFTTALLADLGALDYMLDHGQFESGVRRIGAEQEMFFVDRNYRPAGTGGRRGSGACKRHPLNHRDC